MGGISLYPWQLDALSKMKNGCILCGGVGSGKSRTALAYYYLQNGGYFDTESYTRMKDPTDLYIITTARKRNDLEWEGDMLPFMITTKKDISLYDHNVVVDSWNNVGKYVKVKDAFFIFDEQRVVGKGAWVKSFLKIAKANQWILLSATPGDTWSDYLPVFMANGFFRTRTEFNQNHVVFNPYVNFPQIDRYLNEGRLIKYRNSILVQMPMQRHTTQHHVDIPVRYDTDKYSVVMKDRWNPWTNKPIKNASEFCQALRKVVNSDNSRLLAIDNLLDDHPKAIVFYNFNYEVDALKAMFVATGRIFAEWNGHKHEPVPDGDKWVYLVQYAAGAEGWNCTKTDTVIFYSQNYSYKVMVQSAGRIDRLNTPFKDLYFYHLKSNSSMDLAISKCLKKKKKFNESEFDRYFKKKAKEDSTNGQIL